MVEGFGNDGIRLLPQIDVQLSVAEDVTGICLGHLHRGFLTAHGRDEAGYGDEAGQDQMSFAVRDAALDTPEIPPNMFENLPIAPPPSYRGRPGPRPTRCRSCRP